MYISQTARTTASPEKIWKIWTDVTNWKKWDPFMKEAKLKGSFAEKAKGILTSRAGLRRVFKITRCIPNFTYTVSMRFFLADIHIHRYLGYNNQKTTFTHEFWVEGPLGSLWWSLIGRRLEKIMQDEMEKVKLMAESVS
jgi:hypothetical protein